MNGFDLVVLVIVLFCMIRGLFKGLIREVSGIVAVIAGFYGAITYYWILSDHLAFFISTPETRHLAGFGILFCGILVVVGVTAALIRRLLHLVFLGWVDRSFGLIFGTAKGALIVSVLFVVLTAFIPTGTASVMKESESAPYLAKISRTMTLFVSRTMRAGFLQQLEKLKVKKPYIQEGKPIGNTFPYHEHHPDPAGGKRVCLGSQTDPGHHVEMSG
ncbi:MAG TPA: CvpA family protein [Desulfotignum sp.]|nr:CvpA family protein [Desulfotignum sp.]